MALLSKPRFNPPIFHLEIPEYNLLFWRYSYMKLIFSTIISFVFCRPRPDIIFLIFLILSIASYFRKKWHRLERIVNKNRNFFYPTHDQRYFEDYMVCAVQFSSVAQSCPTVCDPMNHSTPGLPVHHQLPESTQIHVF